MVLSLGMMYFPFRNRQPNRLRILGDNSFAQSDIALYPLIPHRIAPAAIPNTTWMRCRLP